VSGAGPAGDSVAPEISVVVTCFNQATVIEQTLASVAAQSHTGWECVVVDDGSTDGSAGIVLAWAAKDPRFRLISKANGGVASARNRGVEQAKGRFVLPLDGDDLLHPRYVERALGYLESHPETRLVHCKTRLFGAKKGPWRLPQYSYALLLWQNMIINSAVYRRSDWLRTGGYSEALTHGFEDWEFYVRLLDRECHVHRIDAELFLYRVHAKSRSAAQMESGRYRESMRQIYELNRGIYDAELANPIATFADRMKELAPHGSLRYKRQVTYLHIVYLTLVAVLTALILLR
jgi:glycosyltransferase involved in cell wall biosynthesis